MLRVMSSPKNGVVLPDGKPFEPGEEARERGRKGGKRSGEVRRYRKTLREDLEELLSVKVTDSDGRKRTRQEVIALALILRAMRGDVRAFEVIRDTIGERPVDQHEVSVTEPDFSMLDAAFESLFIA